jgi:IS30 family transposase
MLEVVLLSSCRVKKGLGRRPLSDQHRRFMQLREKGWSIRGATREAGVSRSAAMNWTHVYQVVKDQLMITRSSPIRSRRNSA